MKCGSLNWKLKRKVFKGKKWMWFTFCVKKSGFLHLRADFVQLKRRFWKKFVRKCDGGLHTPWYIETKTFPGDTTLLGNVTHKFQADSLWRSFPWGFSTLLFFDQYNFFQLPDSLGKWLDLLWIFIWISTFFLVHH